MCAVSLQRYCDHRHLHSFPTRRSSDLETQWQLARDSLARAIAATGNSDDLRAALRYCQGHLHRINGEAHKTRRSEEHTSELQSQSNLVCRLLLEKKNITTMSLAAIVAP